MPSLANSIEILVPLEDEFLAAELELDTYYWDLAHAPQDSTLEADKLGLETASEPAPVDSLKPLEVSLDQA